MNLTDLSKLKTPGITRDQIFDKWVDTKELLKQTGLSMVEAEQAESKGMFQRSLLNLKSAFRDSMYSVDSIGLFHQGKEVYPVLADREAEAMQQGEDRRIKEEEALEKELENNAKIVELNSSMLELDKIKANYIL